MSEPTPVFRGVNQISTISKWLTVVALLSGLSTVSNADVLYSNSSSFFSAVGRSITDNFSEYGATPGSPVVLTDAQMSAVFGQTRFQSLTFPNENQVGYDFINANSYEYCAGCNGGFEMYYNDTSVSSRGGVYGVGFDIDLDRSPLSEIPNPTAPPGTPGTLIVNFTNGTSQDITIPADIGFYTATPYYFGITNPGGIASIILSDDGGDNRDWIISDLTIAAAPRIAAPEIDPTSAATGLTLLLGGIAVLRGRKQQTIAA